MLIAITLACQPESSRRVPRACNALVRENKSIPPAISVDAIRIDLEGSEYSVLLQTAQASRELELRAPIGIQVLDDGEFMHRVLMIINAEGARLEQFEDVEEILERLGVIEGNDVGEAQGPAWHMAGHSSYFDQTSRLILIPRTVWQSETLWPEFIRISAIARGIAAALLHDNFGLSPGSIMAQPWPADARLALRSVFSGDLNATVDESLAEYASSSGALGDEVSPTAASPLGQISPSGVRRFGDYYASVGYFLGEFGTAFVEAIRIEGGWREVNEIYSCPPTRTIEVVHPSEWERSTEEQSAGWVGTNAIDSRGCMSLASGSLGFARLRAILLTRMSETQVGVSLDGMQHDRFNEMRCGEAQASTRVTIQILARSSEGCQLIAAILREWAERVPGGRTRPADGPVAVESYSITTSGSVATMTIGLGGPGSSRMKFGG